MRRGNAEVQQKHSTSSLVSYKIFAVQKVTMKLNLYWKPGDTLLERQRVAAIISHYSISPISCKESVVIETMG